MGNPFLEDVLLEIIGSKDVVAEKHKTSSNIDGHGLDQASACWEILRTNNLFLGIIKTEQVIGTYCLEIYRSTRHFDKSHGNIVCDAI